MLTFVWIVIVFLVLIQYIRNAYSRYEESGVSHFKPLPMVGNLAPLLLTKKHVCEEFDRIYRAFPNDRFVGRYEFLRPTVVVRDLDLIKKVTIKDFEHFIDHRSKVDDTLDPLFGRNLFSLKGQEWKDMRSTLSPAFTSAKMRGMVPFMVDVNSQMINVLKKKIKESGNNYLDIECKDLTTRYANDVIASCAFGVKVNSHTEEDNEFYTKGRSTASFGFRSLLIFLGYSSAPKVMKKLQVKLFSEETTSFFTNLVLSTMKNREERNILRPDMIHLLMQAKKGQLTHDEKSTNKADTGFATVEESDIGQKTVNKVWSDTDLVAQATLFFVAGFETISTTMSFVLHELAVNPDIQNRLVTEIQENEAKTGGKFDYNTFQNLTYLDNVISEALRLWSPAVGLERICVKDYNMGRPNDKSKKDYIIRRGEGLVIPMWSIHHDPEYFPDPYKFDPDRFSDENKHKINPNTFMPFGVGPRNCIGSRFALCEVKVMIYQLLQHFEVSVCEKTMIPAKLDTKTFNIRIQGGHWIRFKLRQ